VIHADPEQRRGLLFEPPALSEETWLHRRSTSGTSIVSYLAARPSRDVITLARQQLTQGWWTLRRPDFRLFISQLVLDEIGAGDQEAATRRLQFVREVPLLDVAKSAVELAKRIQQVAGLPKQAAADAMLSIDYPSNVLAG